MRADCMLSVGTSAFVYPAAGFPLEVKRRGGALVEVNLYESDLSPVCDVVLKGKAAEVLPQLVNTIKAKK
jgi:NAD-dependent deacetylase